MNQNIKRRSNNVGFTRDRLHYESEPITTPLKVNHKNYNTKSHREHTKLETLPK